MTSFKAGFGRSTLDDAKAAVNEAVATARAELAGADPGLVFVAATVDHDAGEVYEALRTEVGDTLIHGITTSLGILGKDGVAMGEGGALAVMLFAGDSDVVYAAAGAELSEDPRSTAVQLAKRLKERTGDQPAVLLFNASPGAEEDLLAGVADVFPDVPAYGGSAADHAIAGEWSVFTNDGVCQNGLSIAAISGAVKVGGAFRAPYRPRGLFAKVTAGEGRNVASLEGRPAAAVLQDWVGDSIGDQVAQGGNILAQTALKPIGIKHAGPAGDHYVTIHPAGVQANDGSLDVFARVTTGQTLCAMEGSVDGLIAVLPQLLKQALADGGIEPGQIKAALLTYCAGCAAAVGPELDHGLRANFGNELAQIPLLGVCTFGEQGHVPGIGSLHANLSVNLVLLG